MAQCLLKRVGTTFKAWLNVQANPNATITITGKGKTYTAVADNSTGIASFFLKKRGTYYISTSNNNSYWVDGSSSTITIKSNNHTYTVLCKKKIALVKPSLSTTYFETRAGSDVSPGYNNYNSNLINVSGTTKAAHTGNYTVLFTLKDQYNYCWDDGSIGAVSCGWSVRSIIYVYNYTVGYADGATVNFYNNGGGGSGKYCAYAENNILIEHGNSDSESRYATFNLYQQIPANKTIYWRVNKYRGDSNGYCALRYCYNYSGSTNVPQFKTLIAQYNGGEVLLSGIIPQATDKLRVQCFGYCYFNTFQIYYYE